MKDRIDELLELTYENNKMLKLIIAYINYVNINANNENDTDFIRNILANVLSNKMQFGFNAK